MDQRIQDFMNWLGKQTSDQQISRTAAGRGFPGRRPISTTTERMKQNFEVGVIICGHARMRQDIALADEAPFE
jgi:hypothetical protein